MSRITGFDSNFSPGGYEFTDFSNNSSGVTQEEIDYQQAEEGGSFWSSFFSSAVEAIPGTLQGIGGLRASRNPNLTSYSPSLVGDSTYVTYGNNRRGGFTSQDRPIGEGSKTMTIVIASVVAVLVIITLFILLRKK